MITKEQKRRLGLFSLASIGLLSLLIGLLIMPALRDRGLPYTLNFRGTSVNGLYVGAPVKYQGVEIGRVAEIRVHPLDLESILVHTRIIRDFPVLSDMTATLTYTGITGLKFVELAGGSAGAEELLSGGEIPTARGLGEKAEDIVSNIDGAIRSINTLLSPENQSRISEFLEASHRSAEIVSRVLQDKEASLSGAIVNIEKAAQDFGGVTGNLNRITSDLSQLTGRLEGGAGTALENLTKRFSDEEMGQAIFSLNAFISEASLSLKKIENVLLIQQADLRQTVESLAVAVDNLAKFSRDLVEDPALFLRSRKGKK